MTKNSLSQRRFNQFVLISVIIAAGLVGCDNSTGSLLTEDTAEEEKIATGDDTTAVGPGDIMQITSDPADQMNPNISIDRIVYDDNSNGNLDVFMYCLTNNMKTQVTFDTTDQKDPDISEGRIVWAGKPSLPDTVIVTTDIFFLALDDETGMQITFTPAPIQEGTPEISGGYVIWDRNFRGHYGIYDVAADDVSATPRWPNGMGHAVWDNQAVFSGYTGLSRSDLYLCDLSIRTCDVLFIDPGFANYPDIHEDYIVWQDNQIEASEGGEWDIFFYNISDETKIQITSDPGEQQHPAVFDQYIVWEDNRNGNWDIFLYNIATQTATQITSNSADQRDPAIYGNFIVWEDNRNGNWDIFLYEISENE